MSSSSATKYCKLLVLGDGAVGKSSLLIVYSTGTFPREYVPTVFDNYSTDVMVEGQRVTLALWDTAGQEDYDRLRPLSYPCTDIFFLCFDVSRRASLENIASKWLPEITHHCPGTPAFLVGCKKDVRSSEASQGVSYEEARQVASDLGLPYYETSSLNGEGVNEVFQTAMRSVLYAPGKTKKKGFLPGLPGLPGLFRSKAESFPSAPVMPPAGKAPWIEISTAMFAEEWQKALEDPRHTDVTFVVDGNTQLYAHRIILSAASFIFSKVLEYDNSAQTVNQLKKVGDYADNQFSQSAINQGKVPGLAKIYEEPEKEDEDKSRTVIEPSPDIQGKTFVHVLEYLYTGVPKLKADTTNENLVQLIRVSQLFKLAYLETICDNISKEEDELNPSIGTWLNDDTGKRMKDMFLNKPTWADIIFKVDGGQKVYAHKAVVSARCEVMAAMFSGHFIEGHGVTEIDLVDVSLENLLAFLEYLYTDHAPIEEGDSVGIMVLANQFCIKRLVNMCELYITKEVDRACAEKIEKSDIDVIGLLQTAEFHNADQLENWCLHFISTNYLAFKKRAEFEKLSEPHLEYIEEHQWPPVSYIEEVKKYEELCIKSGQKCSVM